MVVQALELVRLMNTKLCTMNSVHVVASESGWDEITVSPTVSTLDCPSETRALPWQSLANAIVVWS